MDVITRAIIRIAAIASFLAINGTAAHASDVIEGKRCFGSESAINNNLPLYATSDDTNISRIEGIFVPVVHRVVGWLYTTRNGTSFIQVGSKNDLGAVFTRAAAPDLAAFFNETTPFAYYQLTNALAKTIRTKSSIVLAPCYGTGK